MQMVSVVRLTPGMSLGKSVFSASGRILLRKGVALTPSYIGRLKTMGFTYVYIEDSETAGIEDIDSIPQEVRVEVVGRLETVFHKLSDKQGIVSMTQSGELGREVLDIYRSLFSSVEQNPHMLVNLSAIYSSDAHTYVHCMNVAVIATILGLASGYDKTKAEALGIGAMMHDIGKIEVSPAIVNKPGKLTDAQRAEMNRHCLYGYELLRSQRDLPTESAYCALTHHEFYDGSGYPDGVKGDGIHEFGRLLAVPDVFDALTSNRAYRRAWLPSDALEFLYAKTFTQFDPKIVKLFVRHFNIYPVGLPVELSNGKKGVVYKPNAEQVQRPTLVILEEEGRKVTPYEYRLADYTNVTITKCNLHDD